jgi:hypothetical protein
VRATEFLPLLSVEMGRRAQRVSYETRGGSFPCVVPRELGAQTVIDFRLKVLRNANSLSICFKVLSLIK